MSEPTAAYKKTQTKIREALFVLFGEINVTVFEESFILQEGSTFVYVRALPVGATQSCVEISSYVVVDVEVTEALMHFLLTTNTRLTLGGFGLSIDEQGKGTVVLSHTILGETLSKEELFVSVSAIARVADDLDDQIVATFGGRTAITEMQAHQAPAEYWEE
jgi:hypothetical protein